MKETIEELFEQYGHNSKKIITFETTPQERSKLRARNDEIIKEITTKIEENVFREVMGKLPNPSNEDDKYFIANDYDYNLVRVEDIQTIIKSLAESKGIKNI